MPLDGIFLIPEEDNLFFLHQRVQFVFQSIPEMITQLFHGMDCRIVCILHKHSIRISITHGIEPDGLFGPRNEYVRLHQEQVAGLLGEGEEAERGFGGIGERGRGKAAQEDTGKPLDAEEVFEGGGFGKRELGRKTVVKSKTERGRVGEFEGELRQLPGEKQLFQNSTVSPQIPADTHFGRQLFTLGFVPQLFEFKEAVFGEKGQLLGGQGWVHGKHYNPLPKIEQKLNTGSYENR